MNQEQWAVLVQAYDIVKHLNFPCDPGCDQSGHMGGCIFRRISLVNARDSLEIIIEAGNESLKQEAL